MFGSSGCGAAARTKTKVSGSLFRKVGPFFACAKTTPPKARQISTIDKNFFMSITSLKIFYSCNAALIYSPYR